MLAAVVYEEEYELYGHHRPRSIDSILVQREGELEDDFQIRVRDYESSLKSLYSFYESEIHEVETCLNILED